MKKEMNLRAVCRQKGLKYLTIYQRIKTGWTIKDALSTPINSPKKYIVNGKEVEIKGYCDKHKLDFTAVRNRIYQSGMSFEDAIDFSKGTIRKKFKLKGREIILKHECSARGFSYSRIQRLINIKGMSVLKAFITEEQTLIKKSGSRTKR